MQEDEKFSDVGADRERREWAARLENDVRALEISKRSYEQEQRRLRDLHAKSAQTLKRTLLEGKAKFLSPSAVKHAGAESSDSAQGFIGKIFQGITRVKTLLTSSLPQDQLANAQILKEQINWGQKEMSELLEKQQNLIKDAQHLIEESVEIFAHHQIQLEAFLRKLEEEPTANKMHLQQCQILFGDANSSVEKLREEYAKKIPNLALCNSYMIEAGKFYQACYRSIIALVEQQPTLQSIQISGYINLKGAFHAGGNIYIGHGMTINQTCQTSENALREMLRETKKKFEVISAQYDQLQQSYQQNKEELTSSEEILIQVQEDLYKRLHAEKVAAEKQAAEQMHKATTEAEQTKKQMETTQQIAQLEATLTAAAAQIEKTKRVEIEADGAQPSPPPIEENKKIAEKQNLQLNLSPAEQAQIDHQNVKAEHPVLRENQYDEHRALMFAVEATQSELNDTTRLSIEIAWEILVVLASSPRLSEQEFDELLAVVMEGLKENRRKHPIVKQILTALTANPRLSEQQIAQILIAEQKIARILTIAIADLRDKSWSTRDDAQEILAAWASYSRLSGSQIAQILLATITNGLKDEDWRVRVAAQQTLAALAENDQHLSKLQIAQILAATVAGLKNADAGEAVRQTLLALANNPHCTQQLFTHLVTTATTEEYGVKEAALKILNALANNPRCTQQIFTHLVATVATTLKDKNENIQKAALQTLTVLASYPHCAQQSSAQQLFTTATIALRDKDGCVQGAPIQTLTVLAGNLHYTEQIFSHLFTQLLTAAIAALKDGYRDVQEAAMQTLIALANNPRCTKQQFTQLFAAVTTTMKDKYGRFQEKPLEILAVLANNPHCTEQLFAQLFSIAINVLQDKNAHFSLLQATYSVVAALVRNPHCVEQPFAQLFSIAINALQDKNPNFLEKIYLIVVALTHNPYCTEQPFTQLLTATIAAVKDENSSQCTALMILVNLVSHPNCTDQLFAQLFTAVINALKDKEQSVQRIVTSGLPVLAGSSHIGVERITQIFVAAIISVKDEEELDIQRIDWQTALTLVSNPHLSRQQTTQMCSVIASGLKGKKNEWHQRTIKNTLIQQSKDCSLDQLPRYITLANTLMQDADTYVQLFAVLMLVTIHQRCRTLDLNLVEVSQAEEKQEELSQSASSAGAATVMGLLPKPKEQAASNNPVNSAAATTVASAIQPGK
jgi:hypothetical protein